MLRTLALLASITSLASAEPLSVHAGACATMPFSPVVLTPADTSLAAGGGVIVGLGFGGGPHDVSEVVAQPGWRFLDVNRRVVPAIQMIAPGLAVYALPPGGGAQLTLEDGKQGALVRIKRAGTKVPELAAPKLTSVVRTDTVGSGYRSYGSTQVIAKLASAAPEDAAALVIFAVEKSGRVAQSWAGLRNAASLPQSTASEIIVYQSGGRCLRTIPGFVPATAGQRATVAWLDRSGRLSPMSNEITVSIK